jgi:hypothetical protein
MSKRVIAFSLLLLIINKTFAQSNAFKITGKILNENNTPLEFVSVYLNSTSIFTHTDSLGRFILWVPNSKVDFELVVSLVGFKTQKQKFTKFNIPKFLSIKLIENQLEAVVIKAKQDRYWWKKYQIFRKGLLGENQFSKECSIENRDFIHLKMDSTNKIVLAHSSETFLVLNHALGYKIHIDLFEFNSDGVKTGYSALKYFENDLSTNEKTRETQLKNRHKAFSSTSNSFLNSLANGRMARDNYEVFKVKSMVDIYLGKTTVEKELQERRLIKASDSTIYRYDSLNKRNLIYSELPLLVFNKNILNYFRNPFTDYTYAFSKIDLPNVYAVFTDNGFISIPNGITFHFHWGNEGLASALPENYEVPTEKLHESDRPIIQLVFEPKNADSVKNSSLTTSNQTIGYKKTEYQNKNDENNDLLKPDYAFKPTNLERSMDIFTLLRRLPGLKVTQNFQTGEYNISFPDFSKSSSGNNTPSLMFNNRLFSGNEEVISVLQSIETNRITLIGMLKYGNGAIMGARGGNGTIIIKTDLNE